MQSERVIWISAAMFAVLVSGATLSGEYEQHQKSAPPGHYRVSDLSGDPETYLEPDQNRNQLIGLAPRLAPATMVHQKSRQAVSNETDGPSSYFCNVDYSTKKLTGICTGPMGLHCVGKYNPTQCPPAKAAERPRWVQMCVYGRPYVDTARGCVAFP
jgi:hypothetical protein